MKKLVYLFTVLILVFTSHSIAWVSPSVVINSKTRSFISLPTDYFRSNGTTDWSNFGAWESSPDNGITPWAAATLIPTSAANIITIRNGHTITVTTNQNMDQVVIEGGGVIFHTGGTLTVNDGTGDDIIVQSGGIFNLLANPSVVFSPLTATANINTGAILRVSGPGLTGAGVNVNASNYIYNDASVLEYTLIFTPFSSGGVTYFPNVNASTIPIFRITSNVGTVGAGTNTVINGLFEANGNVTFSNSGTKTFRNGITGTGNIDGSTSGKFIMNGATAKLGGSGPLTLPSVNGMDIGSSTTVTMVSNKSVTNNISLLSDALVMLGIYNLTMTGNISGGSATSHIVTNSTGKLVINNIGPAMVTFPIGANTTTINPLVIYCFSNVLNYGARVEIGINPTIRFPVAGVNRTWIVNASGVPMSNVNVNFFYSAGDGNALFNYASNVQLGFHTVLWNVIQSNITPIGLYEVQTLVGSFAANTDAPMVIGNIPAILESNNSITLTAQKQNDKSVLSWAVYDQAVVAHFIPERSVDGRSYTALTVLSSNDLEFTDIQPLPGLNYYRIKMTGKDGKITYSNIAAILNSIKGFDIISITPNPIVNSNFKLNMSAAQKMQTDIVITDMQGRVVQKQSVSMIAGFNVIPMNVAGLAAGTYQVYGFSTDRRSRVLRFVIQ